MLEQIASHIGYANLFVLDNGILTPRSSNNLCANLRFYAKESEKITQKVIDDLVLRLVEIQHLSKKAKIIIPSEIKEEFRDFILTAGYLVKGVLKRTDAKEEILGQLQEYLDLARTIHASLHGLDPRERHFRHPEVFAINKQEPEYITTLEKAKQKIDQFPKDPNTRRPKHHYNDAHLATVAYILNKKEYSVCVLSNNTAHIPELIASLEPQTSRRICHNNGSRIEKITGETGFDITIFSENAHHLRNNC